MSYKPDQEWGFLNGDAQVTTLPAMYAELENTANNMGDLLRDRQLRQVMDGLEPLEIPDNLSKSQYGRLWTIYSMLSSAYIFSVYEEQNARSLPKSLAAPMYTLSKRLGMPPIMNYEAFIHNNFRVIDRPGRKPEDAPVPEDFDPLFTFSSPKDATTHAGEKWFIAVQVAAEKAMASAVAQIPAAQAALAVGDDATVIKVLQVTKSGLDVMTTATKRLPERLDPKLYTSTPLQYVFSFKGIHFDGVEELKDQPQHLRAETGGQSVVPRALAAFLGIDRQPADMTVLGEYMAPDHRDYVASLKTGLSVKSVTERRPVLIDAYNEAIQALMRFRQEHARIAMMYVGAEAFQPGPSGSRYMADNLRETRQALHRPSYIRREKSSDQSAHRFLSARAWSVAV